MVEAGWIKVGRDIRNTEGRLRSVGGRRNCIPQRNPQCIVLDNIKAAAALVGRPIDRLETIRNAALGTWPKLGILQTAVPVPPQHAAQLAAERPAGILIEG